MTKGANISSNDQFNFVELKSDNYSYRNDAIRTTTHELAHSITHEMLEHTIPRVLGLYPDDADWLSIEEEGVIAKEVNTIFAEGITELIAKTANILNVIESQEVNSNIINTRPSYPFEVAFFGDLIQALAIELAKSQLKDTSVNYDYYIKLFNNFLVKLFGMLIAFARGDKDKNIIQININGQQASGDFLSLIRYFLKKELLVYTKELKDLQLLIRNNNAKVREVKPFVKDEERLFPSWQICRVLAEEIHRQNQERIAP